MKIIVALIAAFLSILPAAAAAPVVTVTQSAASIPRYEVYEVIMTHTTTYTYPNDDVTITNVFTAPSGKTFTIGGFYYDTNTWKTRFAPKEVGNYTWTLSFDNGSGTPYTTTGSFTSTASTNTGFLIIDPNNPRRFITEADNKPFFINGFQYGGLPDAYHPSPITSVTDDSTVNVPLVDALSIYQRAGLNIWRSNWQSQDAGNPYLTRLNNSSSGKNIWSVSEGKRMDEVVFAIHQSGLKKMQTLSTAPLTTTFNTVATGNSTALTSYVKHFINRWGAYTDIWEIGNEINGYSQAYMDILTNAFHNNDPYNHPLTNTYPAGGTAIDESGLTAANTHTYRASTNLTLDTTWAVSAAGSSTAWGQYIGATVSGTYYPSQREYYPNKPMFSGECGNASPYGTYDPERYRIPIWTAALNDSGTIYWLQFNRREQYPGGYSNMYIATEERAMNKVFSNLTTDLDDQVTPVATASVVCSPSASIRGYVTASSTNLMGYFVHSNSHASVLSGATVTIPIPANNMRGQWIDPATGAILQEFTVNSGTQTLTVPSFQVDAGLRIRSASTAPIIEFAKASYITFETAGSITITVNRTNTSTGAVSVNYATSDGLAVAGTNYTAASGTLSWGAGDLSPKTFTVPLLNDGVSDQDKDFVVTLSNPTGGAVLEGNVTTIVADCDRTRNFNPLISSALTATTTTATALNYTILGTGSPTSFNATSMPTGLSINTATGALTGTVAAAGSYSITITATNVWGSGSNTLVLTVNPPAPVINSTLTASASTTAAFNYQITATNSPTGYNATGLPTGLTVDTTSGIISGTPTQVGTFNVTISATNVTGTGSATLVLTVTTPGAPVVSSAATATGTVGTPFTYSIVANNAPTSYAATGLPPGVTVNTSTGVLSGTPTTSGVYYASLTATNQAGTGASTVSITIYQATGGVRFAYEGFNYAAGASVSTGTEISPSAFGFSGAWTTTQKTVSPGLVFTGIPSLGTCVQWSSNVNPTRTFNMNVAPAGTTKVDTDSVTRIGSAGTNIWIRVLLQAGTDADPTHACNISLTGVSSGGANKLSIGNLGNTVAASQGFWSIYHSTAAGNNGKSNVAITAGQTVMLVAHISYGVGTNKDLVELFVNPSTATTPPATPDVSLPNISVGAFDKVAFSGFRVCNGDELSIGTDWLSAVSPNAAGFLAFNNSAFSQHEGTSGTTPATVTVSRTGGSLGAVSVHYATSDGTAIAGTDYVAASGTLNWADGDTADKTFPVTVNGTSTYAANKTVNLTLSAAGGGAAVGVQSTATLTLLNDNTPRPIPTDDFVTVNKNTMLADILVMANDTEPSGYTFSITSVGSPAHGTAQVNPNYNPTITYIPTTGYSGSDLFTYTLTDSHGQTAVSTVDVTVLAQPRLTIMALGDSITVGITAGQVSPEQGYRGPLLDSLIGAGIPIQYVGSDNPGLYGTYDPAAMASEGHSGYVINDLVSNLTGTNGRAGNQGGYWLTGGNGTGRAAVSPDIVLLEIGGNDAAGAGTPSAATMQGYLQNVLNILKTNLPNSQIFVASLVPRTDAAAKESVSVQYSAGIPSMVSAMGANFHFVDLHTNFPSNGLSSDNLHPAEPGYDWMASQWFAAIQTVLQPVANTDTATTAANTPVTVPVLTNDTDPAGYVPLTVSAVGTAAHGTVVLNANNTVTYTPASNYTGTDTFGYTVADSRALTANGTVNVTITAGGQTFASWASSNGLTGNNALTTANPSKDGIPNLIKYALGLDPNAVVSAYTDGTHLGLPSVAIQGSNLTLMFQKDLQKTDITYTPQFTTDLSAYSTSGITQSVISTTGSVQTIVASISLGADTKKYLRLQITIP